MNRRSASNTSTVGTITRTVPAQMSRGRGRRRGRGEGAGGVADHVGTAGPDGGGRVVRQGWGGVRAVAPVAAPLRGGEGALGWVAQPLRVSPWCTGANGARRPLWTI